jgi:hypothetical protein
MGLSATPGRELSAFWQLRLGPKSFKHRPNFIAWRDA